MPDPTPTEVLVFPVDDFIKEICRGVAAAQRALDQEALAAQESLQRDHPDLHRIGYRTTWYHMPEVEAEIKIAVHYEEAGEKKRGFFAAAFNGKYRQTFSYDADGASSLRFRLVPVPPPYVEVD